MVESEQVENLFGTLVIERAEALPKRESGRWGGRPQIPNPFVDAMWDSYREGQEKGPEHGVRALYVPVSKDGLRMQERTDKDKEGNVKKVHRFEQHPNMVTALAFLREAAAKHGIGCRIVVDYTKTTTEENGVPVVTYSFIPGKGEKKGTVRVRFLGQKRKEYKKGDDTTPGAAPAPANAA